METLSQAGSSEVQVFPRSLFYRTRRANRSQNPILERSETRTGSDGFEVACVRAGRGAPEFGREARRSSRMFGRIWLTRSNGADNRPTHMCPRKSGGVIPPAHGRHSRRVMNTGEYLVRYVLVQPAHANYTGDHGTGVHRKLRGRRARTGRRTRSDYRIVRSVELRSRSSRAVLYRRDSCRRPDTSPVCRTTHRDIAPDLGG